MRSTSFQKGVSLTEVNLAVVISIVILVPFMVFYGGLQQAFLTSYDNLNYLNKTKAIGEDLADALHRINSPAADSAAFNFPVAPANVVDYIQPTDKHLQLAYTPYKSGAAQNIETYHYVYDEANEQLLRARDTNNDGTVDPPYEALTKRGEIKAVMFQYFDTGSDTPVAPAPLANPTNIRRVRVSMIATPQQEQTITKGLVDPDAVPLSGDEFPLESEMVKANPSPLQGPVGAAVANTLTPINPLVASQWNGAMLAITDGKGKGQKVGVVSNNGIAFTVAPAFNPIPDATSTFRVYQSDFEGTAEAGTAVGTAPLTIGTLQDSQKTWIDNEWMGFYVSIVAGTGVGQTAKIVGNTSNTLSVIDAYRDDLSNSITATAVANAAKTQWKLALDGSSRYMILPRFYPAEVGSTTAAAAGPDYIIDADKTKKWQIQLYTYKNRPAADRDTRVYSSLFQGFALEIYTSKIVGNVSAAAANTLTPTEPLTNADWTGATLNITGGTGNGQSVNVTSNTGVLFNVAPAFGVVPDATSTFEVIAPAPIDTKVRPVVTNCVNGVAGCAETRVDVRGTFKVGGNVAADNTYRLIRLGRSATVDVPSSHASSNQYAVTDFGQLSVDSGAANTITDTSKSGATAWALDHWIGGQIILRLAQGDNSGKVGWITDNTADTITFSTSPAPALAANAKKDDRYMLLPPDNQPVVAAANGPPTTVTLVNPPVGVGYPLNYWKDGYIEVFDPNNFGGTHQIRKILGNNGLTNPPVVIVNELFASVPTATWRYRIFHDPKPLIPFSWISEVALRRTSDAAVF